MAIFSCEAHNDKGLTVSRGVQVNVKGERRAGPRTSGGWGVGVGHGASSAASCPVGAQAFRQTAP